MITAEGTKKRNLNVDKKGILLTIMLKSWQKLADIRYLADLFHNIPGSILLWHFMFTIRSLK